MYFWLKYYMYGLRKKRNSFSLDAFYMSGPLSVHFNGGGGGGGGKENNRNVGAVVVVVVVEGKQ